MRALAVLALAAALAGCGGSEQAGAPETAAPQAAATAAPEVAGTTLDGEAISLDAFLGKPVALNVWSSW